MKAADDFGSDEALDEIAAAWLCERDEGFAVERAQAFAEWRRDPRHDAAVRRVECALALISEMPAVRSALEARFENVEGTPTPARRGSLVRFPAPALIGAAAAMLVLAAVAWSSYPSRAPGVERYATDVVAQRRVALRDGSVVEINTASEMQVDFTARERRVSLSAGEAHFQVAADAARPFVVSAGGVSVRAVGTAFNVRIAADSIEVLVLEGKVEVVRAGADGPETRDARALLVAGERAQVARDFVAAPKVEKAAPESIRAAIAWQDPLTTFNDVPLREVITRLNQRNATQLVLDDAQLGERKIGGVIALNQLEAFVRLLEQGGDVVAERRGDREIRLRRAQ